MKISSKTATQARHKRVRKKVIGTLDKPRFSVFRSHNHIYAQIIDDTAHRTLVASSTLEDSIKQLNLSSTATCTASAQVGQMIAQKCLEKGIVNVVFDRGGKLYHGRVKALAEAARQTGLNF
uniref:Large ribosomal subunit protein uL18c n=1 Tax=Glaucocystis incrassata TaxID=1789788 RepID=A0A3G1IVJ4_9EUKA|nr:ribosomal protein L18 [Glaucocystis incrassata]ASQ40060.1 ribosomal protein L18 [Glaucocystis incrassata]